MNEGWRNGTIKKVPTCTCNDHDLCIAPVLETWNTWKPSTHQKLKMNDVVQKKLKYSSDMWILRGKKSDMRENVQWMERKPAEMHFLYKKVAKTVQKALIQKKQKGMGKRDQRQNNSDLQKCWKFVWSSAKLLLYKSFLVLLMPFSWVLSEWLALAVLDWVSLVLGLGLGLK